MRRSLVRAAAMLAAAALLCSLLGALLGPGCSYPSLSDSSTTPTSLVTSSSPPTALTTLPTPRSTVTVRPTTTSTLSTTTTRRQAVEGDAEEIAAQLSKSVVGVTALMSSTRTEKLLSVGTGVVLRAQEGVALIVTNDHVIARDDGSTSKQVSVRLPSGSVVSAAVVGRDPASDLALLRVRSRKVKPALFRTDLSTVAVGDWVVAIGNPKVLKKPVTSGRVTALLDDVEIRNLPGVRSIIESSVPLEHGNSGGPLVDVDGWVIGINTGELQDGERALSLPSWFVLEVAARLLAQSK
jgi:S1-C subfamily serine protease